MKFASERKLFCCPLLLHLAPSLSTISCVNSCIESEIENVQRPRSALFSVFFLIFLNFFPSPARPGVPCTYIHPHFTTRLRAYNYIAIFPSFNSFQLLFHFRFSHFSIRFPPLSFSIYTNTRIYCLFAFRSQTIFVLRQK